MVHELLMHGKEFAIPGRDLCGLLGIDLRTLTGIIETERRNGEPICASQNSENPGYYLAADKAEMDAYCRQLAKREKAISVTRKACIEAGKSLEGRNDGI